MEGISHEAISIAGHLKLNKLIVFFDNNGISIDGPLGLAESGDQVARFAAAGWNTMQHRRAQPRRDRRCHRGGAEERPADDDRLQDDHRLRLPDQGRHPEGAQRSPLGEEEIAGARKHAALGFAALRDSRRHPRRLAHRRPALQSGPQGVGEAPGRRRQQPARRVRAAHARRPAAGLRRGDHAPTRRRSTAEAPKVATRKASADGARGHQRRSCPRPSAARPT